MGRMTGRQGKLLVPILGGLAVVAMMAAGYGFFLQSQEHAMRLQKEQELARLLQERDALQVQIASLQTAKSQVETELGRVKTELTQSKDQTAKTEQERDKLAEKLEQNVGELSKLGQAMDQMMKELSQVRTDKDQLASQLTKLNSDKDMLAKQLDDAKQQQQSLESKISELSRVPTVQLDKVLVSNNEQEIALPSSGGAARLAMAGSANGQVLVINRDYNFVVMDMGKNQGLSIGQEFKVVRGEQVIGKVKVEKVYDDLSAAAILPETKEDLLREGDQVRAL